MVDDFCCACVTPLDFDLRATAGRIASGNDLQYYLRIAATAGHAIRIEGARWGGIIR